LEDNKEQAEEAEVKIIMEIEPGKKCWQYRDFWSLSIRLTLLF
jgi:hypothetical protein